ncbi:MAG: hypothetical protein WBQ94_15570 [Terracidiphilus sp.]
MSKANKTSREEARGQVKLSQGDFIEIDSALLHSIQLTKLENSAQEVGVLVVSHDCDIETVVQKEPYIEVIPVEFINKLNSKNTHTRNSRILEIEVQDSITGAHQPIRILASNKRSIHKPDLWDKNFRCPYNLSADNLAELADWLSSRYRRAALPEEFGNRFRRIEDRFWKLLEHYNQSALAILFFFDEGQEKKDCAKGEPYILTISLVFKKGTAESDFDPLIENIYALFETTYNDPSSENPPEIEIRQCVAISESDITLEAYKAGIHLRSEWISYGTDPPGPVIGA